MKPVYLFKLVNTIYEVVIRTGRYIDDGLAIWMEDSMTGEKVGTISVALAEPPAPGCIWIKDYGENEGLAQQLVKLKLVEPTGRTEQSGFVTISEYRLVGDWADLDKQTEGV